MWSIQPVVQGMRRDLPAGIAVPASTLLNGLISYWKLDEVSGVAVDSVGANTLTDNNTVGTAAGKVGTARQFTAANVESLSCVSNASLVAGGGDLTVSAWVWLDSTPANNSNRYIIGKRVGNTDYALYLNTTAGGVQRFAFEIGNAFDGSPIIMANTFGAPALATWYRLWAEFNATTKIMSIAVNDGATDSRAPTVQVITDGAGVFRIGAVSGGGSHWDGRIDDLKFWKRVLTPAERAEDYANGIAGIPLL